MKFQITLIRSVVAIVLLLCLSAVLHAKPTAEWARKARSAVMRIDVFVPSLTASPHSARRTCLAMALGEPSHPYGYQR
jgi:hypothetical protein